MAYTPKPIDTSDIVLPPELHALTERLAENAHDVWGAKRVEQGWTLGAQRDDAQKKHPCLVPYAELSEGDKDLDRVMCLGVLKAILKLGYRIVPPGG